MSSNDFSAAFKIPYLPNEAPLAADPPAFKIPLYEHQKRSLARMLAIEGTSIYFIHFRLLITLISFCLPQDPSLFTKKFNFRCLDYESIGGCLCDDIGMGKTATILALICSEPMNRALGANLLVGPPHLVKQWTTEAQKFVLEGEIDIVLGVDNFCNANKASISNRTVVIVNVDDIIQSENYYYNFRRLFHRGGVEITNNPELIEKCKKAAIFVSKGYVGKGIAFAFSSDFFFWCFV